MLSGVYEIRCSGDAARYIGSSENIPRRWRFHRQLLARGVHNNTHLQRAWTKYGAGCFSFSVLEQVPAESLIVVEQAHLDAAFGAGERLFNVRRVADRNVGCKHSPETLAKMSAASRGRKHSPATKAKMLAVHLGAKRSPETVARITKAKREWARTADGQAHLRRILSLREFGPEFRRKCSERSTGRLWSEASRAKLGAALRGRVFTAETRSRMSTSRRRLFSDPAVRAENVDRILRGQAISVERKRNATHCRNGHEFTAGTIRVDKKGLRHCRTCKKLNYELHKVVA